jgi:hypothetical protein
VSFHQSPANEGHCQLNNLTTVHTHTYTMASSLDHQAFGKTRAEWLANLNTEFKPPREFRRTSIICTIGSSSSNRADH